MTTPPSWLSTLLVLSLATGCGQGNPNDADGGGDDDDGSTSSQPSGTGAGAQGGAGSGGGPAGGAGPGGGGPPPESCDPYQPRVVSPETWIAPSGIENKIVGLFDSAQTSIDLMMYQFSRPKILASLVAAKERGVAVRVILDGEQYVNADTKADLTAAGIEVKDAPAAFTHAHAKIAIIDGARAMVFSGNFNSYSMVSERNYGVIDHAADDVADMQAVFETDWSGAPLDLSCTRLVVSPDNSRDRILGLIGGAKSKLDMAVMYISDDDVLAAVQARAAAGVAVRVLLASPGWIDENTQTAAQLEAAGVQAKFLNSWELHAKLIIADETAFVGSENMSWTSLDKNREIGVFVTEPEALAPIVSQMDADWADGD